MGGITIKKMVVYDCYTNMTSLKNRNRATPDQWYKKCLVWPAGSEAFFLACGLWSDLTIFDQRWTIQAATFPIPLVRWSGHMTIKPGGRDFDVADTERRRGGVRKWRKAVWEGPVGFRREAASWRFGAELCPRWFDLEGLNIKQFENICWGSDRHWPPVPGSCSLFGRRSLAHSQCFPVHSQRPRNQLTLLASTSQDSDVKQDESALVDQLMTWPKWHDEEDTGTICHQFGELPMKARGKLAAKSYFPICGWRPRCLWRRHGIHWAVALYRPECSLLFARFAHMTQKLRNMYVYTHTHIYIYMYKL